MARDGRLDADDFYATYHGHEVSHLEQALAILKPDHPGMAYLAGDSSMDNKYWLRQERDALNGYENVLEPSRMRADVSYFLNKEFVDRGRCRRETPHCCLNAAVEATTLRQRFGWRGKPTRLTAQDCFIRDNICEDDFLIVSVGGNDIALSPTVGTIFSMLRLVHISSDKAIEEGSAWGLGHFIRLFREQVQAYVQELVSVRKPRRVLVCMIYYPDEAVTGSWATRSLGAMAYNKTPPRLQGAIRKVFELATSEVRIDGVDVVPFPLFLTLDGKTTGDYVHRVEPSAQGGRKMAGALAEALFATAAELTAGAVAAGSTAARAQSAGPQGVVGHVDTAEASNVPVRGPRNVGFNFE